MHSLLSGGKDGRLLQVAALPPHLFLHRRQQVVVRAQGRGGGGRVTGREEKQQLQIRRPPTFTLPTCTLRPLRRRTRMPVRRRSRSS